MALDRQMIQSMGIGCLLDPDVNPLFVLYAMNFL